MYMMIRLPVTPMGLLIIEFKVSQDYLTEGDRYSTTERRKVKQYIKLCRIAQNTVLVRWQSDPTNEGKKKTK
jgi:hypothetical protein